MATHLIKRITSNGPRLVISIRLKTTSSQYVASRVRDATFEKFMDNYKNLLKVISIQDLILANPNNPPTVSVDFLNRLSQKFHLNRGATAFLRRYPRIFDIYYDPNLSQPFCKLTPAAMQIAREESAAIDNTHSLVIDRLTRLLSMSLSKTLPLRAIFKVWRELGLPDDFEDSIISKNRHLFQIVDAHEPGTHLIKFVGTPPSHNSLTSAVENWRVMECCKDDCSIDRTEMRYSFKHTYPPCMKLKKNFRAKVKEWQKLPYVGPYEEFTGAKKKSKLGLLEIEKHAVAIVHEFLSLTVEKTVEVEKISHFRKWFGVELNVRDLFLDHPGMFYLSTKGKRHTVFLREAYERGRLIDSNPVYDVRRKLLDLVVLGRRGLRSDDHKLSSSESEEDEPQEMENE
uniref:protein ROOT PRIMORDIUM DEFECTIVE 1 n=1 Tax=Erigeron canadensis TaxID=72917 RepID=UPI001CB8FEA5|nr:protein ROOT PRIMORDIUM DEFECTIVE 1 [Erigeron canadensis]XP_043622159.1 protein ROOT PRIMORDIUM DEFECTIVE 1 [Erigeron canadensis]